MRHPELSNEREVTKKTEKVGAERSLRTTALNQSPFGDHGVPSRKLAASAPNLSVSAAFSCLLNP
jgi:hypothetical protein